MPRSLKILRTVALCLVVAAVVLAPWGFGADEPWIYLLFCLVASAGLWLCLFAVVCDPAPVECPDRVTNLLVAVFLLMLLQLVPLPAPVLKCISPWAADAWDKADALLASLNVGDICRLPSGDRNAWPLSLAPVATYHSGLLFLSYIAVFTVVFHCVRSWRHLEVVANVLVFSGCLMLLVAIVHKAGGVRDILWFHEPAHAGDLLGPFTNRNHFAMCMNMVFALAAGMAWISAALLMAKSSMAGGDSLGFKFVVDYASDVPLRVFMAALAGAGVFFSLSRGGMLSLLAALILAGIFFVRRGGLSRSGGGKKTVVCLMVLLCLLVIALGWSRVFTRFMSLFSIVHSDVDMGRLKVLPYVCQLAAAFWVTGCGFGAFQYVFPAFQGLDVQFGRWLHAHNEVFQVMTEGGLVAVILSVFVAWALAVRLRRSVRAPETRISLFGIAVVIGVAAVGLQSLFDYGLRKPANAWMFAVILALGVRVYEFSRAANNPISMDTDSETGNGWWAFLAGKAARGFALAGLVTVTVAMLLEWQAFGGMFAFAGLRRESRALEQQMVHAPGSHGLAAHVAESAGKSLNSYLPELQREVATFCGRWALDGRLDPDVRMVFAGQAVRSGVMTVRGAPADYLGWLVLGRSLAIVGEWSDAQRCLERARQLAVPGTRMQLFTYPVSGR